MKSKKNPIHVVLFCGGRGSATIIHELLRWPNIELTLIVNAYDDGLSTGALRDFIAEMLGPSDFRKNLSYLLDLHSKEQYALKQILECRLSQSISEKDIAHLIQLAKTKNIHLLTGELFEYFKCLSPVLLTRICELLNIFFEYATKQKQQFDFRNCSLGNLIFAGAYLKKDCNFNAASKEMSQLVCSKAVLVNISQGENRVLIGLNNQGELLENEAKIVGDIAHSPIRHIFLTEKGLSQEIWHTMQSKTITEKEAWLSAYEKLPSISLEAITALETADIIVYGPGTQHSSLYPSYRIAQDYLKHSPALVKAFIMNLAPDNDIHTLSASDVIDRALYYAGDSHNTSIITHILYDNARMAPGALTVQQYKNAEVIPGQFGNQFHDAVHNGHVVVNKLLELWKRKQRKNELSLDIFVDIEKRSMAAPALSEEFLELDWRNRFAEVRLAINRVSAHTVFPTSDFVSLTQVEYKGAFPEVNYFMNWLKNEKSDYLVLMTGDGEYRFRDALLAIRLLEQSSLGAVFGSRTQSRLQFKTSVQAAYGENKLLYFFSFCGAFLMSAIFALRYGVIFSDPLTGFRIFKRSAISHLATDFVNKNIQSPVTITKYLIKNKVEVAELPVNYRTFSGFTDPHWRIRRGIRNLLHSLI